MKTQFTEAVFTKPEVPQSDWQTFKWMFFEPTLLRNYSKTLSKRTTAFTIVRVYRFIILLIMILYLLFTPFLVQIDLPTWSPESFRFAQAEWLSKVGFVDRWMFLCYQLSRGLFEALVGGLAFGLIFGLISGLSFGLIFGLFAGLILGLTYGMALGLALRLALGLDFVVVGLTLGLIYDMAFGLAVGLTFGLAVGLAVGLFGELTVGLFGELTGVGLAFGLAVGLGFYAGQFRLVFYPFYYLGLFKRQYLTRNAYLYDEGIWLPLPWVKNALRRETVSDPELGFRFVDFLLRYRPLQYGFAAELEHLATAARWKAALRLHADTFNDIQFLQEGTPKGWEKLMPSAAWRNAIVNLRDTLRTAENQTAAVLRQEYYEFCGSLIGTFEDIHKRESFKGKEAYYAVIEHWKVIISNQLIEISQEVKEVESVTTNPYSKGLALSPKRKGTIPLFLDRDDIKKELLLKIQTSLAMPTFLIIGQRRVGKTSLLNFLPEMLPPSFVVAPLDAQRMSGELSVPKWFREWRAEVVLKMNIYEPEWLVPDSWTDAWEDFAAFLIQTAEKHKRRIILVMDEYDEDQGFHGALRQHTRNGEAVLGRMRAFSQSQNWVVFMFIGATYFSDLPAPNLAIYFPIIDIQRVDYLSKSASLQLIERPVPKFELRYQPGVAEKIYELTVGHPHLLHSICSDLVDYANSKKKNPIGFDDLDFILREKTVRKGEMPFTVFWDEFCDKPAMRKAVLAISKGQNVDAESVEVRRLIDYGYIIQDEQNRYKMRVPLFADWVIKCGY